MSLKSCLSFLLPLTIIGCNNQETRVTNSIKQDGTVAIAPRFASAVSIPQVARLKVTLSVSGRPDSVIDVPHSPGESMVLGSVPKGSSYEVTALGYDTAGEEIPRFWGKGSGTATNATEAAVVIPLSVGPENPVAQADSLVVGGHLTLSSGMWYTLDGSDPRAAASKATPANGPITMDKAGTVKAASKTATNSAMGSPVMWSGVSSWTFAAAGSVVSKDTSLSGLSVSPIVGSLTPFFASTKTVYVATVDTGVTSVTLTATPKLSSASVVYGNGSSSGVVNLGTRTADSAVPVTVSNGGKSLTYTVTIKRKAYELAATPRDSTLSELGTSPGNFNSVFSGSNAGPYVDSVPAETGSVTIFAVANKAGDVQSITYNGATDNAVTLNATGNTTISVKVTNLNGNTRTYLITVARMATATSSGITWNTSGAIQYGSVKDPAGQTYRTVRIGTQWWMAENLNYAGVNGTTGTCYGNDADSCTKYGRLYTGAEAKNGGASSNSIPSGVRGICPVDWHLPSDAEWTILEDFLDSTGVAEGTKLKSSGGWSGGGNGTDAYGFRALPGGHGSSSLGFKYSGTDAGWWSSTLLSMSTATIIRSLSSTNAYMYAGSADGGSYSYAVRCVMDVPASSGTGLTVAGMKRIPAGTFTMGSSSTEINRNSDETQHRVTLSAFYMDSTDVTQGQYQTVMGVNPSHFTTCGTSCPVEQVTWFDAILYCNARSKLAGLDTVYNYKDYDDGLSVLPGITTNLTADFSKNGYRLPTEAQWEYAARGGTTTAYYWGDVTDAATVSMYAWFTTNSNSTTHPVASKLPNAYGLYDMAGNVWRWMGDWYGAYPTSAQTDPSGASSGTLRVLRGGSWNFFAPYLRSSVRHSAEPKYSSSYSGIRVVRPAP